MKMMRDNKNTLFLAAALLKRNKSNTFISNVNHVNTTVLSSSNIAKRYLIIPRVYCNHNFGFSSQQIGLWVKESKSNVVFNKTVIRGMAVKIIKTPPMAESIQEGTLTTWHKAVGEYVGRDEQIATIETDKIDITVNSPESGVVVEFFAQEGDTVQVGGNMFSVDTDGKPSKKPKEEVTNNQEAPRQPSVKKESAPPSKPAPTPKTAAATPPSPIPKPSSPAPATKSSAPVPKIEGGMPGITPGSRAERRVKMSRMRTRISERLKDSQNTAASLTTFNEIDMSALIEMRNKYKDEILDKHGVKLGFMSPFIKAASIALQSIPEVNARIEGDQVVYNDFVDISVAVATPKGLVTPVLRNCESMSLLETEKAMAALSAKARNNDISIEDMAGGTFTISNGGVFGSLMGTPIINQPQSAILGMHATKDRPVVVNGQIVIRPMMYVALTYDHRLIDGREAVTFLVKVKQLLEDPRRMLLDL